MDDANLRQHLVGLLRSRGAHPDFAAAVGGLEPALHGRLAPGCPHTPWQLVEHLRIAQWDILEFCRSPEHASPPWPDGYWPASASPPDQRAWERSVEAFRADLEALCDLVRDPATDLLAPLPWGGGQTVLHQALLAADHNAYHLGQLVLLRRLLGAWPA
ncbi:MAG: DinB family protein [Acidobacteria bacterium]|nr:MAG: DinB family protein [Acidobacteriota bacterium]